MNSSREISDMKSRTDCRALARSLGLKLGAQGMVRCFASPQSHANGDRTPSCSVRFDGFRCFGCGESGDVFDLVRAVLACGFPEAVSAVRGFTGGDVASRRRPPTVALRRAVPPPQSELNEIWRAGCPVGDVPEVAEWLRERRGIDPVAVEEFDLARALPADLPVPRWARFRRRSWPSCGLQLIVPCFDERGRLVSMRARRITGVAPKEIAPSGHRAGGLMADALGRLLLAGELLGDDRTAAAELVAEVGVVICEGATDFLSWATSRSGGDESAPMVLGLYSGAWSQAFADRVPHGTRITIATDDDPAGERYSQEIARTFATRQRAGLVTLARWRAKVDDA